MIVKNLLKAFAVLVFSFNVAFGQNNFQNNLKAISEKIIFKPNTQIPDYIKFRPDYQIKFEQLDYWLKANYGFDANYSLKLLTTEQDQIGFKHYRFQQLYRGLPVEQTMYIVHVRNGYIVSMNGLLFDKLSLPTQSSVKASQALTTALNFVHADKYMWQDESNEQLIKQECNDPSATWFPKAEMVYIAKDLALVANQYTLAYKFDVYATEPLSRQYIYVDAQTNKILTNINRIHTADTNVTAKTAMAGDQRIVADYYAANSFRLREASRGNGIETYNLQKGTNYGSAIDFTDSDTLWNNVNGNKDQYATDVHFGSEMTYDFYKKNFNRNSIDNAGFKIKSYMHYSNNYVNAFWNGTYMTYGDGNGTTINPLVSLDIAGHEITHGLTTKTANLTYSYESGALNESFSDVFGTAIEWYGDSARFEWDLATKIGWVIRSMSNPKAKNQPDTYKGTNWYVGANDNGGVHTNSGVQNFWYYLLCTGDTGTNDKGDFYSVDSIGMEKANAIAYRTLTYYLISSSQYADARTYSILSAIDLYGACSNEHIAVAAAWHAVGVGNKLSFNRDFTVTQNTNSISQLTNNNVILMLSYTPACSDTDTVYTFTFNTTGTTKPSSIKNAKLYYTNTSTFATTSQYGSTVNNPNGVFTFSGNKVMMKSSSNYFWLTYDLDSAKMNEKFDANITSILTDSVIVPNDTAPAGYRMVEHCVPAVSTAACIYMHTSNVILDSINNTSGCNSTSYSNFSNLSTTTNIYENVNYDITVANYNQYINIWVDYDQNGVFDSVELVVKNKQTVSYNTTGFFTIPATAKIGKTKVRIKGDYNAIFANSACSTLYYGETEDYSLYIDSAKSMFITSVSTKQNRNNISAGSVNADIIRIKVNTKSSINPLILNSYVFNTKGSTDTNDIVNARLFYTGTDSNYNTTRQVGATVTQIDTSNFNINDTVSLKLGANYFWIAYTVDSNATIKDVFDAQCISMSSASQTYTPDSIAPYGNRLLDYCTPVGGQDNTNSYNFGITQVTLNTLNNASGIPSNMAGYYVDYTNYSTYLAKGLNYTLAIKPGTSAPTYPQASIAWIDWNKNNIFDSIEEVGHNYNHSGICSLTVNVSASQKSGKYRMRIMSGYGNYYNNGSTKFTPCASQKNYVFDIGECEDYTIEVVNRITKPTLTPNTTQTVCLGTSKLYTTAYDSSLTYSWYKNGNTLIKSGSGHPYDSLTYTASAAGTDSIRVKVTNVYNHSDSSAMAYLITTAPHISGNVSTNKSNICAGDTATLSTTNKTNSTQWQYLNNGNWINTNTTSSTYKVAPADTLTYRIYGAANACPADSSNTITINVSKKSVAGSLSPVNQTICLGDSVTLSLTGTTGAITWGSYNGNTWQSLGLSGNSIVQYPTSNIVYRAIAVSGVCKADSSNKSNINVTPHVAAGVASISNQTICIGDSVDLTLTNYTGSIQWQVYNNSNWSNISYTSSSARIAPSASATYRAMVKSGNCFVDSSNQVSVAVSTKAVAGSISAASNTICVGDTATLTLNNYQGKINWQVYNNNTWQDLNDTNDYIKVNPNANTSYRVILSSGVCSNDTAIALQISVTPLAVAGTLSTNTNAICTGDTVRLSISGNTGTIGWQEYNGQLWQYFGNTDSIALVNPSIPYTYRAIIKNGNCGSDTTNSISININPEAIAGNISSSVKAICPKDSVLLTHTGNTGTTIWEYFDGNIWSALANNSDSVYVSPTTKTEYRIKATTVCGTDSTLNYPINVYPPAKAAFTPNGPLDLCNGDSIVLLSSVASNYRWSNGINTQKNVIKTNSSIQLAITDINGCKDSTTTPQVYTFHSPVTPTLTQQGDSLVATPTGAASYTWKIGNNVVATTTSHIFIPKSKGIYTVEYIDIYGCKSIASLPVTFSFVGVLPINSVISELNIWPNPSEGIYNLKASFSTYNKAIIRTTDMTGKIITEQNISVSQGQLNTVIDLSNVSKGVYLLYIVTEDGQVNTPIKLIKE